ncbi:MAG: SPOR domain-containing protein [Clostridium sp.]|nr:SPOR domain-containing protein [Clostridium sp.]
MKLKIWILALSAGCSVSGLADDAVSSSQGQSIVDDINSMGGSVYISQPPELDNITNNASAAASEAQHPQGRLFGYRIQVFSDNNIRTAKAGAENRKRAVETALPDTRAYIIFDAPYWRVKFGDYRTYGEADEAMQQLLQLYPQFASDAKIVKERINTASQRGNAN